MMQINWEVDTTLMTDRTIKRMSKLCNRLILAEHKAETLKKHFEINPDTRPGGAYGYEKRGKRYMIRKARIHGHQLPLVFDRKTPGLKASVLGSARITATAHRGRLIARGSTKSPLWPQQRKELEVVSEDEREKMVKRWGEAFLALSKDPENHRKKRKRGKS